MERTTEPKIVLLVRLLNAIDEGRHSFESLKDRIAEGQRRPSTRSLRRYLAVLSEAGFPWHFERTTNSYRFAGGYSLKRLDLSGAELFGLVALRSFGASIGGSIGSSINEITEKLLGSSGSRVKMRVESGSPVAFRLAGVQLDEHGEKSLAAFEAGERSTRSVEFIYQDKEGNRTTRIADPYGFVVSSGRIYCIAYDHGRRDKRSFAIDNVSDARLLAKTFTKPSDFDIESYAATSISGVMSHGELSTVRVRFAPRVAKAAIAARVVAERQMTREDDGSVTIEFRVSDVDELVRWVLGWGSQAEIEYPAAARARIAQLSSEVAAKYRNGQQKSAG